MRNKNHTQTRSDAHTARPLCTGALRVRGHFSDARGPPGDGHVGPRDARARPRLRGRGSSQARDEKKMVSDFFGTFEETCVRDGAKFARVQKTHRWAFSRARFNHTSNGTLNGIRRLWRAWRHAATTASARARSSWTRPTTASTPAGLRPKEKKKKKKISPRYSHFAFESQNLLDTYKVKNSLQRDLHSRSRPRCYSGAPRSRTRARNLRRVHI